MDAGVVGQALLVKRGFERIDPARYLLAPVKRALKRIGCTCCLLALSALLVKRALKRIKKASFLSRLVMGRRKRINSKLEIRC